jgi:hypothetical protein
MSLDKFDFSVLEEAKLSPGDYSGVLNRLFGWKNKREAARKKLGHILEYLRYKEKLQDDKRTIGEMEETVTKADGTVTSQRMLLLSEEESKDPNRIMELMGFDVLQWEMLRCEVRRNDWDVTMKLKRDDVQIPYTHTNHAFMVKVSVKPIQKVLTTQMIKDMFAKLEPPKLVKYENKKTGGQLLEIPIMDLHLGKLSWARESGDDYDLKIAETLYRKTLEDILDKVYVFGLNIEKIVFPIGQDFFHFDTTKGTTVKGTVMDTDTRWPKMYEKGIELSVWAIENLRAIAPVEIIYVAANHDKMMSFFLTHHVSAYFRNCEDVTINTSPYPRKYVTYGKCLIGYSHGSEEGKKIDILMQQECPTWSKTLWREWHLGHLHSEHAREIGGIIIRIISSITSRDEWHTEHGYQAVRKAQAFVWDREKGKQLTIDSNIIV